VQPLRVNDKENNDKAKKNELIFSFRYHHINSYKNKLAQNSRIFYSLYWKKQKTFCLWCFLSESKNFLLSRFWSEVGTRYVSN